MLGLINCFTRGEQELPRIIFNIIGYVLSDILFWLATLTSIQTYQLRFLSACSETDSLSVLIYFEFSQRSQKLLLTPTALTLRFEFTLSGFPKNVCVSGEKTRKIRSEKLRKMRISLTRFHCGTLGEHFFAMKIMKGIIRKDVLYIFSPASALHRFRLIFYSFLEKRKNI